MSLAAIIAMHHSSISPNHSTCVCVRGCACACVRVCTLRACICGLHVSVRMCLTARVRLYISQPLCVSVRVCIHASVFTQHYLHTRTIHMYAVREAVHAIIHLIIIT